MSEAKKETQESRTPYKIDIEPISFESNYEGRFMSSMDFCKLTNQIFRAAFVDYVGCTFEVQNGYPSISLYFSHARDLDGTRACDRVAGKQSGNSIIDKTRGRDLQLKEGDRYHITDDGIDIIKPLLQPRYFNQGKPNWKQIVTDITDRSGASMFNPNNVQQLTKVIGIDPRQICAIIYGSKDEEGSYVDYGIEIKADLTIRNNMMPTGNPNYAIVVTKAYNRTIADVYEKLGIATVGSNIVR